jgi:hypothetical protein
MAFAMLFVFTRFIFVLEGISSVIGILLIIILLIVILLIQSINNFNTSYRLFESVVVINVDSAYTRHNEEFIKWTYIVFLNYKLQQ